MVDTIIAKRHLMANKKQTLVAMLGVTFGIAMFILMISFMIGVNQFMEDTMLSSTPDIHIYNDIKTDYSVSIAKDYFKEKNLLVSVHHPKPKQVNLNIKNASGIINDLQNDPEITRVSPFLSTQVFYNYGPVQINGYINGVRSYTGYIKSKSGTEYTFSFIVNNFDGNPGTVREKIWKILDMLK